MKCITNKKYVVSLATTLIIMMLASNLVVRTTVAAFAPNHCHHSQRTSVCLRDSTSEQDALQRTAAHLERLQKLHPRGDNTNTNNEEALYQQYLQRSANSLKEELKSRGLPRNGRKPDLARRLATHDLQHQYGMDATSVNDESQDEPTVWQEAQNQQQQSILSNFAGLQQLSRAAGQALGAATFHTPSPIQKAAIPVLARGESCILHAETGSGKTLAYLLPITEQLWLEQQSGDIHDASNGYCVILTPTRELAAQVAGIATVLAPPGSVRLVSHPTNLLSNPSKDKGEDPKYGGRLDDDRKSSPRIFVGSAKSLVTSLYGDGNNKMPAPPTSKPQAMFFLRNVRWLILDEVDRLLDVKKTRAVRKSKVHEKPAAIVTSAVARLTLGRAQIVAVSATVGRPLKRELARVLGLPAQECPPVIRGEEGEDGSSSTSLRKAQADNNRNRRAVTIPTTVQHYVTPVDGSTVGKLLTSAFFVIKSLSSNAKPRRILLVLTRGCDLNTQNAIGALKHFGCQPEPKSLLDALEAPGGTDHMIQVHREVSGAKGVGESYFRSSSATNSDADEENRPVGDDGYLLVTGEDTIRGLHLDGLDFVIVVGRPHGPDEYTHIAGRTGRAGRSGKVINVVSAENAVALTSWEHMLDVSFTQLGMTDVANLE